MSYKISAIFFSDAFYKATKTLNNYQELKERLELTAKNENMKIEEVIYFFTKQSLDNNHFFEYNEDIKENLYFKAAYWASKQESKQKTRPKNFKDVDNKNYTRVFTKLLASTVKSLYVKHKLSYNEISDRKSIKNIPFNIEMEEYLNLLFEISCIKRDRMKNNDL